MRKKAPNTNRQSRYPVQISEGKFDRVMAFKYADTRLVYLPKYPSVWLDTEDCTIGRKPQFEYEFGFTLKLVVYHNGYMYYKDTVRRYDVTTETLVSETLAFRQKMRDNNPKGISLKDMKDGMSRTASYTGKFSTQHVFNTSTNDKYKDWPL